MTGSGFSPIDSGLLKFIVHRIPHAGMYTKAAKKACFSLNHIHCFTYITVHGDSATEQLRKQTVEMDHIRKKSRNVTTSL